MQGHKNPFRLSQARQHLLLAALLAAAGAQAQVTPADISRQNDAAERLLQERLRQEQERARDAAGPRPQGGAVVTPPRVTVPDLGVACRDIQVVRISGATRLKDAEREAIEREFSGRCLKVGDLEAILARITKWYVDAGFVTTRAYLPAQDLRTGTLEVTVVEGTIEKFEVDGPRPKAQFPAGAFPKGPGELLNLRDLEQGIDQINRLGSNAAQLDLQPGSTPGQSVVIVRNPSTRPVRLFLSYDNLGTGATGRNSASATVSFDSLLGFNELVSLTRRQSILGEGNHANRANALAASIPWGYNTFSLDASESTYDNQITTAGGTPLLSEGRTTTVGLTLDRVLYRDAASRISGAARLGTQDSRSWLGGQFLTVASRKLTTLDVSVSGFTALLGGIGNARLGYTRGLHLLGGLDDPPGLPDDLPHARFGKATLDLGFNRRFHVGDQPLLWASQLSVQQAQDTLFGSQQIAIGGVSSVRGFLVTSLAGDSGAYWRNELGVPLAAAGVTGRAYVAFDAGNVRNRAPGAPSGSLSGATLGVSAQWHALSFEAFVSRAVSLPSTFTREPARAGVRLSYSL